LDNPEKMKTLICTYSVSEARKELLTNAYDYYLKYRGLTWDKPRFIREDKPFFLPTEEELGILISNAKSTKMSTFLQFLKETACDSGEAWKLKWIDIDVERKTVNITPTKNHSARTIPISDSLLSRLMRLERKNEKVFASKDLDSFSRCYALMRNRLSVRLNNPRMHLIAFRSFRHWKATDLYYKTKDILYVKWFLGHKRLENTLVYTHLIPMKEDQYICRVAESVEVATELIEQGFEFVCDMDSRKMFRKRK
jgi:integrase